MRPNRLPRDTEDIPRGFVYCSAYGEWLAPGTAYDCAHGVPFGVGPGIGIDGRGEPYVY